MIDTLSIVLRALSFVTIFQATGMAIFLSLFKDHLGSVPGQALRRTGVTVALFALALVSGHFALEPARMSGALSGFLDPGLRQIVLDSPQAGAFGWRIGGLVALAGGLIGRSLLARVIALLGVVAVLASFTQVGHTASSSPRLLLAGLLLIHLGIAAFWFGSLLPLRRIALRESHVSAGRVVEAFSRVALLLVPLLAVAGLALVVLLLRGWTDLASPYGRLILLKASLFAALMGLAAMNRWRFGPGLAAGNPVARRAFARTVLIEYILIAAVLAATAALTTLYSPGVDPGP